jgi:hypothetical protein
MKVTNPWKRLLAALAAGGVFVSGAAYAANLNQNLLTNSDFETVTTTGSATNYASPTILNWSGTQSAYAYSHDGSQTFIAEDMMMHAVPDFATNGVDPPNAGHWYFTSNRKGGPTSPTFTRIDAPGEFYQDIDLSTGDTGTLIAGGNAVFKTSAYMTSYYNPSTGLTDQDIGRLHINFLNSSDVSLGTSLMSDDQDAGQFNEWNLNTMTGVIPVGTAKVRVSLYGSLIGPGAGADAYMDNVNFQVGYPTLAIFVNRNNGNITVKNLTGADVNISNYSITSAFEGLSGTSWLSITDNYDAGSPGPNQLDADHNWSELSGPTDHSQLTEADNESGLGATMANNRVLDLGNSSWIQNPNEDLVFHYISNGEEKTGIVFYTGNNNAAFATGDFNVDGAVTIADWAILRSNQFVDLSSLSLAQAYRVGDLTGDKLNNHADFVAFKTLYDAAHGSGSFQAMVSSVPEASAAILVLTAGTLGLPMVRRRKVC